MIKQQSEMRTSRRWHHMLSEYPRQQKPEEADKKEQEQLWKNKPQHGM